ncbi:hypothetical protein CE91St43_01360 [Oscillospiraceae bacterium]|nr:hypothetical protein CE91St43_01360 [Oscillospiraceae bacterium]
MCFGGERTSFDMGLSRAVEARPLEEVVQKILLDKVGPARIMI